LKSICISSRVETLSPACFSSCEALSNVAFEFDSRLSSFEYETFWNCYKLRSICLPASLTRLESGALYWPSLEYIGIEPGNRHFAISQFPEVI
jgi:hypothetical protein